MTHEQIMTALAELRAAARLKGFSKARTSLSLYSDPFDARPYTANLWDVSKAHLPFYGATPEAAIAAAANWIAGQILWTPEAVAKTLGIEPARDVRAAAE